MQKTITVTGSIFILLSIILGAMAAHALEKIIVPELIETFEKGVKYQLYTGLGFLIIGLNAQQLKFNLKPFYILNLIGVLLFSGCIYTYSFHELVPALKSTVMIVPLGGICMILAWIAITAQFIKQI